MSRKIVILVLLAGLSLIGQQVTSKGSVFDSKHNLSTSGDGSIKSNSETRVCIFCHSSHNASKEGPLWNHVSTTPGKFKTYARSSLQGTPQQPTGATKLCLSCHDGTIAVGAIKGLSRPIPVANTDGSGRIPAERKSMIGTDLSGTHPVSIEYTQESALAVDHLRWPPHDTENRVGPDQSGQVQCTACHDPHDDSKSDRYPFWNKTTFSAVCTACHNF